MDILFEFNLIAGSLVLGACSLVGVAVGMAL